MYPIRQVALFECPERELGVVGVVFHEENLDPGGFHQCPSGKVK